LTRSSLGSLIAELQPLTYEALEKRQGIDIQRAASVLTDAIDLDDIVDPAARKELENARGLIKPTACPTHPAQTPGDTRRPMRPAYPEIACG
jgi:hypothetical protein